MLIGLFFVIPWSPSYCIKFVGSKGGSGMGAVGAGWGELILARSGEAKVRLLGWWYG